MAAKKVKQAVILAAGKSTRTYPLTLNKPKPLLPIANKPILQHTLEQLEKLVEEVIIVTGFEAQQIKDFLGKYKGVKTKTIQQIHQLGTGHALLQAKPFLKDRFLVLNGDDIYSGADLTRLAAENTAVLGAPALDFTKFGSIVQKQGRISIVEKPQQKVSEISNTGAYILDSTIFDALKNVKKSPAGEYYLTDGVQGMPMEVVSVKDYWHPIAYPWDILDANEAILKKMKPVISKDAVIQKGATLLGAVSVGKGTEIRAGAYIQGPVLIGENCLIGPNCFIRPATTIGNECRIGNGTEVKNSVMFDHAYANHLSYVGDSILGRHVNFAGGTITANLRHDSQNISSMVNGVLVSTGKHKFGCVCGDYAKTGINTSIYPGRKIWPYKTTLPGEVVKKDVM